MEEALCKRPGTQDGAKLSPQHSGQSGHHEQFANPLNFATTLPRVVNLVLNWTYLAEDIIRGKNCYIQSES